MNKDEFFRTLDAAFTNFTWSEKKEIMYDYEEHFRIGLEKGKTEEELIAELGEPEDIANQYKLDSTSKKIILSDPVNKEYTNDYKRYKEDRSTVENVSISAIAVMCLLIFNLIFILGPFLGLVGGIIGLFAGAIGAFFGGIGLTFGNILAPFVHNFSGIPSNISPIASIFFGIGTTAFGTLFFIGDCYIVKYFFIGTRKYINWNLSIIRR
jgi:uncharacterized membrane protein